MSKDKVTQITARAGSWAYEQHAGLEGIDSHTFDPRGCSILILIKVVTGILGYKNRTSLLVFRLSS